MDSWDWQDSVISELQASMVSWRTVHGKVPSAQLPSLSLIIELHIVEEEDRAPTPSPQKVM